MAQIQRVLVILGGIGPQKRIFFCWGRKLHAILVLGKTITPSGRIYSCGFAKHYETEHQNQRKMMVKAKIRENIEEMQDELKKYAKVN